VFYNNTINGKYFFIKDSINIMMWKPGKTEKTILGYTCFSATTSFRGRDYVAYYTTAIPIPDGPFKFGGLPGLILEIKSNDQEFSYSAIKITNGTPKCEDANFEGTAQESFITFGEYKKVFISEMDLKIKKLKSIQTESEKGYPSWMKQVMPEIIYPALQTGQGIQY
jgi:GLPGLI family protein